jgi:hypothetical protein
MKEKDTGRRLRDDEACGKLQKIQVSPKAKHLL